MSSGLAKQERSSDPKLDFSGFVSFEMGRVVNGWFKTHPIREVWQERMMGGLSVDAKLKDNFHIIINPEFALLFSTFDKFDAYNAFREAFVPAWSVYPGRMEGVYTVGDDEMPFLELGMGYFPYTYNTSSTNFGNFLFRGTAYPFLLYNGFDGINESLLGFRLSNNLAKGVFHQDILFTSEAHRIPSQDFSLSYVAQATMGSVLKVGAGISFDHLLSVDKLETENNEEVYFYFESPADSAIERIDTLTILGVTSHDTAWAKDTSYYDKGFRAVKAMLHASVDPKSLITWDAFGPEDLLFYGEIAMMGFENRGEFYSKRSERMPWMVGFNVPTFRLLDVLSLELEHYPSPWKNNYQKVYDKRIAIPVGENKAEWRWSIWAEKTLDEVVVLKAMMAHDHMFTNTNWPDFVDRKEALSEKRNWHYRVKIVFRY
ncbi:MAG: hypothetical protein HQK83_18950 [Fibrobacteria bacterium]|nr:hypothetical protein [Fibrobacteria bacterium]